PDPRLPGTLPEVAKEIEALGRRAVWVQTDVRFEDQIARMVSEADRVFGRVDILVNNAGALFWAPVAETPVKRFDLVLAVNVRAAFIAARECLPLMQRGGWGHVVNMSPPIRPEAAAGKVAYLTGKYGMTLLTYGLAAELDGTNVAVHSLWPACVLETAATIHFGLGSPETWRKPDILADATLALVGKEPSLRTGKVWLDEEVLAADGITDFDRYACVPGGQPLRLEF
ncbi:MAG: SDR family NAD(P)-dependent oxidoreductase, partial [Candidatus Riflebacteria bacterium]|nr:SDR family NAD(P)-dependent oxidoreductase [Candidatus Riflebacteria bacterium]